MDSIHPYCAVFGSVEGTREEVHNAVGHRSQWEGEDNSCSSWLLVVPKSVQIR